MTIDILVATPTIDTVRAIHAALDAHRPLALLHAKASAAEHARQRAELSRAEVTSDDAFVLFTSGSTGPARGVVLSRAAVFAAAAASAAHLGWRATDRWLACLPLAHAGGLSIVVRCYVAQRSVMLGGLDQLDHVTLASLVPTQLATVLDDPRWRPSAQLRAVLLGGAVAPPSLVEAGLARGVPILQTYGLTETFGQVATAREPGGPLLPLAGVELAAGTREVPAPIRIRGPMLATRYLDGAPIAPELVTADLGYLDNGALVVVGRADDIIITGGENVHPAQIEAVLAATPGVRAVAAFGVPDPRWGQIVAAAVAIDDGFDRDTAVARWHRALPAYARPRRLALLAELPRLPSGKVDRRELAALPACQIDYA